jgi:WhiB family redox-sensing transcriptional regulator
MTTATQPKPAKKRRMVDCRCCGKNRQHRGRGLCPSCWDRSKSLGHPDFVPPPMPKAGQGQVLNARRAAAKTPHTAASWSWQDHAACQGEDAGLFFAPDGEQRPERDGRERRAKAICARCPVRHKCLDAAIERREVGVWGGLNDDERQSERRRRMRRANAA